MKASQEDPRALRVQSDLSRTRVTQRSLASANIPPYLSLSPASRSTKWLAAPWLQVLLTLAYTCTAILAQILFFFIPHLTFWSFTFPCPQAWPGTLSLRFDVISIPLGFPVAFVTVSWSCLWIWQNFLLDGEYVPNSVYGASEVLSHIYWMNEIISRGLSPLLYQLISWSQKYLSLGFSFCPILLPKSIC